MAWIETRDARLWVEVDGDGDPVTVVAHGLTNNRLELAMLTPFMPGTKVRFDFRGHGRSSAPEDPQAFRFADFARDLDAVARAHDARVAVGTSLGAGAIANLLASDPTRFDRSVWLMPAGLDMEFGFIERYDHLAEEFDSADAALREVDRNPERVREMLRAPWMTGLDPNMWAHEDPAGLARAIRCVVRDHPVPDRDLLRRVASPVLLVCIDGDPIHPVELGRVLHELLPNSELLVYGSGQELFQAIPDLLPKVVGFLTA
ncbi:MAG: alpha/beta fold hydrolase [Actinomycetota bacterium]